MPIINLPEIELNIRNSGFVLEHQVTEKLISNDWYVINSKYYVDDVAGTAREIDLIAYKASSIEYKSGGIKEKILVYTTLIISCKKNEQNLWALLFRDHNEKNPNVDWFPIKLWSNHKVLSFMVNNTEWRSNYLDSATRDGIFSEIFEPTGHLFAFQEIHKINNTIQNDKKIYESISSLMKAESYEMNSLLRRKKDPVIYNFNLLSIIDTELVKLHFSGSTISSELIDQARTTFNYIVNKEETASRIHFCTLNELDRCLNSYEELSSLNTSFFVNLYNEFYENLFKKDYYRLFLQEFEESTLPHLISIFNQRFDKNESLEKYTSLELTEDNILLIIVPPRFTDGLNTIIQSKFAKSFISFHLMKLFHFDGDFKFEDAEIPF